MVMAFSVTACGRTKGDADKMGVQVKQPAETTKEETADMQGTQNTQDGQGSTESKSEEINAAQIEEDTGSFKIGMLADLGRKGKETGEELKNGDDGRNEEGKGHRPPRQGDGRAQKGHDAGADDVAEGHPHQIAEAQDPLQLCGRAACLVDLLHRGLPPSLCKPDKKRQGVLYPKYAPPSTGS